MSLVDTQTAAAAAPPLGAADGVASETGEQHRLESHSLAETFPLGTENELELLAADIKENGLREPVVLHEGKILDGRRRYAACLKAEVEPDFIEFEGDDPVAFVISKNIHRRHLTKDQAAVAALNLLPGIEAEARKRQLSGKGPNGSGGRGKKKTQNLVEEFPQGSENEPAHQTSGQASGRALDQAARMMGVNSKYLQHLKVIREQAPAQFKEIEKGEKRICQAIKELGQSKRKPEPPPEPEKHAPRHVPAVVESLNGKKFEIVYATKNGLNRLGESNWSIEKIIPEVSAADALLFLRSRLDDWVRPSWGRVGLLAALVLETGETTTREAFNLDVKHELLLVYATPNSRLIPCERVQSLIQTLDPVEVIGNWFPGKPVLVLTAEEGQPRWTVWTQNSPTGPNVKPAPKAQSVDVLPVQPAQAQSCSS